uniref:S protein n=1 Tax=Schistosoma mansoni TaxID=6183 RepID=A0A5K4F8N8_SCHMA
MKFQLLFILSMVLAVYSTRTPQIQIPEIGSFVAVRTRGTCPYCLCHQNRVHEVNYRHIQFCYANHFIVV